MSVSFKESIGICHTFPTQIQKEDPNTYKIKKNTDFIKSLTPDRAICRGFTTTRFLLLLLFLATFWETRGIQILKND